MNPHNNKQGAIGPAVAIVVIIGITAISGVFFYKTMIADIFYLSSAQVTIPAGYYDFRNAEKLAAEEEAALNSVPDNSDLSSSSDLDMIGSDLEASIEADLSGLDDLEAELLDIDDLDDLDFDY